MRFLALIALLGLEVWSVWFVGDLIDSLGLAIWLAVGTSFVGGWVLGRARTGLDPQTLMTRMQGGGDPERRMGGLIAPFVAGVLLVIPGFITDTLGFLLLFPPTRKLLATALRRLVMSAVQRRFAQGMPGGPGLDPKMFQDMFARPSGTQPGDEHPPGEQVREADFKVVD